MIRTRRKFRTSYSIETKFDQFCQGSRLIISLEIKTRALIKKILICFFCQIENKKQLAKFFELMSIKIATKKKLHEKKSYQESAIN